MSVELKKSTIEGAGAGLFMDENVSAGDEITMGVGLDLPSYETDGTTLEAYVLPHPTVEYGGILVLGWMSFVNSQPEPGLANAKVAVAEVDIEGCDHFHLTLLATKDIEAGQEIFLDYEDVMVEDD